ncbi:phage terminase large subunit family protein [Ferrovibrio xuzhouensis]|uniref:Phage terminase large subunit family protein n=1 Tax=Ferrovibrio xuzhouensis TaxID=1576914 RepID=A0ABV7VDH9_9PROT
MGIIDPKFLANPYAIGWGVIAHVAEPPPPVNYLEWAKRKVAFGKESPRPGPYNPDDFPFFNRILEVLGPEHAARVVVLKKSAQLGGTVLAQIFVGASLDLDPSPILYVHPTESNAVRWVKQKWRAMLRQIPSLQRLFPSNTSRDGGNSILYQERTDSLGSLTVSGANSDASLSMISMYRQVQDDLSKWELNKAGDPESQADSRSMAFSWAKIFKIGTALLKDNCRISKNYARSTREQFHVPCPHCDHYQPLTVENFLANLDPTRPGDPHFACVECGAAIEERDRDAILRRGRWVAENPDAAIIGFYLWSAYSKLVTWRDIAEKWLAAKGDPEAERVVYNDWFGLAYEGASDAPDWEKLRDRAEASGLRRGYIPAGFPLFTIGVDCQADRVEWHAIVYGRNVRRCIVDYGVIDGHISELETRAALNALLKRDWPDAFGNRRQANGLGIDGNAWTQDVFDWVKVHPQSRVIMVRGAQSDAAPPLALVKYERKKDGKVLKFSRRFFNVGVSQLKSALYICLKKPDPLERGAILIPAGFDDDYFEQLCSERRAEVKKRGGAREFRWILPPGKRNEGLDTAMYSEAMAIRLGWRKNTDADWDRLEATVDVPKPGAQGDLEDLFTGPARAPATPKPATAAAAPAKPRRLA